VLRRLGAADFGLGTSFHGAVGSIGNEARPVILAADSRRVGSGIAIAPDPGGLVRALIELPVELRELPDSAFALAVERLPGEVPVELMPILSRETFVSQVSRGWTLERDGDRAQVRYESSETDSRRRYNLHLSVLEVTELRLASGEFSADVGSNLLLAYGLTTTPGAEGQIPVRFEARLACGDAPSRPVLDTTISASEERRWNDVAVPLSGGPCRLSLSVAGPDGAPVRGALWAVPRIVGEPADEGSEDWNLVLISLDTLRADHLSGYGYPRSTSPQIDAELIARGTAFMDVTSTYSRTDVSHMSLLSGLYPAARPEPGRLHRDTPLPLLAERLATEGFETAAFAEDALLAGAFGFWFGFDRFTEHGYAAADRGLSTFAGARDWLRANRDRRFFLFVHTYKTHAPYAASEKYASLFSDPTEWDLAGMSEVPPEHRGIANDYDRTIREADDLVGSLLDEIEALGLSDRTLVVLTSDHGEAFGEHRRLGHSFSGYQEVVRVPLVLRGPGVPAGLRVETPVSLVDVTPTILDWMGISPLELSQGISLVPALRGGSLPTGRPLYFSWLESSPADRTGGVRYGRWKFQRRQAGGLLFELDGDPAEERPHGRRRQPRPIADRLFSDYEDESARIRERLSLHGDPSVVPTLSEDTEESLRALGYIE
jgi:arylsulfatase A-like enzyme